MDKVNVEETVGALVSFVFLILMCILAAVLAEVK